MAQIADETRLFVDRQDRFSAIGCFNDLVTPGMAAGPHDRHLIVGRDMSLEGFDDVSDAEAMRPRLTSVATAPVTIGCNAATLLGERIENHRCSSPHRQRDPSRGAPVLRRTRGIDGPWGVTANGHSG
ncbi:MAG: substrate-binding domain-containing protein [Pseudorhizobium sp.]